MKGSWRLYESRDEERVKAIFTKQMQMLGMKQEFPDLLAAPVVLVMVHEMDGEVDFAITLEAVAEAVSIAEKPLPLEEFDGLGEQLASNLKVRGFTLVRSVVPAQVVVNKKDGKPGAMRRLMKVFKFTEEKPELFKTFYRWL